MWPGYPPPGAPTQPNNAIPPLVANPRERDAERRRRRRSPSSMSHTEEIGRRLQRRERRRAAGPQPTGTSATDLQQVSQWQQIILQQQQILPTANSSAVSVPPVSAPASPPTASVPPVGTPAPSPSDARLQHDAPHISDRRRIAGHG